MYTGILPARMSVYPIHAPGAHKRQESTLDALELKLKRAMDCHVVVRGPGPLQSPNCYLWKR